MITFDENASNYIQVTDDALLDIDASGEWCICFWESTSDNTGTLYQYIWSTGTFAASNTVNIYFGETSEGTGVDDSLVVRAVNSAGGDLFGSSFRTASSLTFDGTKRFWVLQGNGTTTWIKSCDENGTTVTTHTTGSQLNTGTISPTELEFGRRTDGNVDRAYGGDLGGMFQGVFNLDDTDIEAIANGDSPMSLGYRPKWYFELASNVANPPDYYGNLTATRNGTLADGASLTIDTNQRTKMILPGDGQIFMTGDATYTAQAAAGWAALSVGQGSFSVTGQDVNLLKNYVLSVGQGSYALNGQTVNFALGLNMPLEVGSFALTGQDVNFLRALRANLEAGIFNLTGQDADLLKGWLLSLGQGSFSLSGQDVTISEGSRIVVESGSFVLSGQDLGLFRSLLLSLSSGSFTLTGQAVGFSLNSGFTLDQGSFSVGGQDVGLYKSWLLTLASGSYSLSGQDLSFILGSAITAETGAFTLTGNDTGLLWSQIFSMGQGSYTTTGQDVGLYKTWALSAGAGSFALSGQDLGLFYDRSLTLGQGSFTLTGIATGLTISGRGSLDSSSLHIVYLQDALHVNYLQDEIHVTYLGDGT